MNYFSLKTFLITTIISITVFEVLSFEGKIDTKEKYLNPLIIHKGLIQSIRINNEKNINKYLSYKKLKIDIETNNGNTPLFEAIISDKISDKYFMTILDKSNVNYENKQGFRAIHIAINKKDLKKVRMITEKEDFEPQVIYNNANIIEFAKSLKNNEKSLLSRLNLNKIIDYLTIKYPKITKREKPQQTTSLPK